MTTFQESIVTGIIGGIVSGLLIYIIQIILEYIKEKKISAENKKVGKSVEKYITEDFLYNYEPGKLTIEKVIQDFGQSDEKTLSIDDLEIENQKKVVLYKYNFNNAIVIFSTFKDESTITSITINSSFIKSHPVKFRFSFSDTDEYFGKALISQEIISNKINLTTEKYVNWVYSALQTKCFHREIKHLYFSYIVCDNDIEIENDMLNKKIDQICISTIQNVCPVINFYEMI